MNATEPAPVRLKIDHRISHGEREYWTCGPIELMVSRWGNRQGWDWRLTNNGVLVHRSSRRKKSDAAKDGKAAFREAIRAIGG